MNISESLKKIKFPVVIIGMGKSGHSAQNFLLKTGFDKDQILTFDEKTDLNLTSNLKSWSDIKNLNPGTLVVSPGVSLQSQNIQNLIKQGWALSSEINLATSVLTDEIIIGITGSVGKSTVTSLLGVGAKFEDSNAFVGGNLGTPFCEYAISQIENKPKAKYIILELSSYQLENCRQLKLNYSAITYLSANHLERYLSLHEYYMAKCYIGKQTSQFCIINSASADLLKYKKEILCTTIEAPILSEKIKLIGKHNLENYSVAVALAKKCKWSDNAILEMKNFLGLPHRLETVGEFNGTLYVNDSKATAMDSVLVAVSAVAEKIQPHKKMHLMLGGKDKNLPWQDLEILKTQKNIQVYFFGECANVAKNKSSLNGIVFKTMLTALEDIFLKTTTGDVVLLSPGGTSLDEFKNFEDRGHIFKKRIHENYSIK